MNKIVRIDQTPEKYDLAGKVIGFAMSAGAASSWNEN
jgi:hypothetical protein